MDEKYAESMRQLFCARWNVPKAALHCSVTHEECEELFREYCKNNPVNYVQEQTEIALLDCFHK